MKIKIKDMTPSVRKFVDDVIGTSVSKEHSLAISRTIVTSILSDGDNVTKHTVNNTIDRLYASVELDTSVVHTYARSWNLLYGKPTHKVTVSNEDNPFGGVVNTSGFTHDELLIINTPVFAELCNSYSGVLNES